MGKTKTKYCNECEKSKTVDRFYKSRKTCKRCDKICDQCDEVKSNVHEIYAYNKCVDCYKICNVCKKLKLLSDYYKNMNKCKKCHIDYVQQNYQNNRENKLQYQKEYYENVGKENRKNKIEEYREYQKDYQNNRYNTDLNFRLRKIISSQFHNALKSNNSSLKYLNMEIETFKEWIEFQFYDGMNWDNYGSHWEIDHTIPVSSFDLNFKKEIYRCFNWKNLRPLRKDKNRLKSNKIDEREYLFQEIKAHYFEKLNFKKK